MNRGPRRLKEDLDFQWETGCDLADEQLMIGDYDLPGMRRALLSKIEVGVASAGVVGDGVPVVRGAAEGSRAGWLAPKPVLTALVGLSLLGGAYWLGTQRTDGPSPGPQGAPGVAKVPTGPWVPAPVRSEPAPGPSTDGVADAPPQRPDALRLEMARPDGPLHRAVEPPPSAQEVEGTAEGPPGSSAPTASGAGDDPRSVTDETAVGGAGEAPVPAKSPARPGSDIPAELRLYDPADEALENGAYRRAVAGFEAYLEAWPEGGLRDEAELGMLRALHGASDAEGTAKLAERLRYRPSLTSHREEILRLQAESLIVLGRCGDALLLAEDLPARVAAPIKRSCRSQRSQR
ncbi:MAG TPA: hypothetical protein ENK18_16240 [Deltaproteobacteria bacterium]|nr:hypothetical protein [Deltaproteobacteria bacterium]